MIHFTFDVEAQDLQKEGFAYGFVVTQQDEVTGKITVLEEGECYSIEGARGSSTWTQTNVIPKLEKLKPYLDVDISEIDRSTLPDHIVITTKELRNKFYEKYIYWKTGMKAVIWSDASFPVETNFLSAMIADGNGDRDWDGPYPLMDVSCFVDVNINRNDYCGLTGLVQHDPLDDAKASALALYKKVGVTRHDP